MFALGLILFGISLVAFQAVGSVYSPGKGAIAFLVFNVFALACVYFGVVGIQYQTGVGEHTGFFTASQTDGIFIKTTGVYFKTDTTSSQEDLYCLLDMSLLPKIKELQAEKKQVTISYIDYLDNGLRCPLDSEIITAIK